MFRAKQTITAAMCSLLMTGSSIAQGHDCPGDISKQCVVSKMVSAVWDYEDPFERQIYVARAVNSFKNNGLFEEAIALLRTHGGILSGSTLSYVAEELAEEGMRNEARWVFELSAHATETKKRGKRHSALDLLSLTESQFENGFSEDARETLRRAAALAYEISDPSQAVFELHKTAVRQRLYGWPEDVAASLQNAAETSQAIDNNLVKAGKLADVGVELHLSGSQHLSERTFEIIGEMLTSGVVSAYDKREIAGTLISAHIQIGQLEAAKTAASKYGVTPAQYQAILQGTAYDIINSEDGYLPKFMPSSVDRVVAIVEALEGSEKTDKVYVSLIGKFLRNHQLDDSLLFLSKIKGTTSHSMAAYDIVKYIARDAKDPIKAEEILLREQPSGEFLPYHPGNRTIQYTLELIGRGFLDLDMPERADPYLQRAWTFYFDDPDPQKSLPWSLVHDLAHLGYGPVILESLSIFGPPKDQFKVAQAVSLGALKGESLGVTDAAIIHMQRLAGDLSDVPDPRWKDVNPDFPSPRDDALADVSNVHREKALYLWEKGEFQATREVLQKVVLQPKNSIVYVRLAMALSDQDPDFSSSILTDVLDAARKEIAPVDRIFFYDSLLRNLE